MPFDPTDPPLNTELRAAKLRNQFNSLKVLIDAVPAGPAQQFAGPMREQPQRLDTSVLSGANAPARVVSGRGFAPSGRHLLAPVS